MIAVRIPPTDLTALTAGSVGAPWTMAGWISPNGEYYRVDSDWGHSTLADRIVDEPGDNYEKLCAEGWLHLGERGTFFVGNRRRLTRLQFEALSDIAALVEGSDFANHILAMLREDG